MQEINQNQEICIFELDEIEYINAIFGELNKNKKLIEKQNNVILKQSPKGITISGFQENVEITIKVLESMIKMIEKQGFISDSETLYILSIVDGYNSDDVKKILEETILTTNYGKQIKAKTIGQKKYVDEIKTNGIVFGIGPAGTGKTYLAMAMAVKAFKEKKVNRIILTRPAVEAGESLGFLPGDLKDKVDPYLRPLYDALFEMMGADDFYNFQEKGLIEVAPLAYMRGRTLDNAFIVLDEAQNTSPEQMKMFLTRLGFGSKAVITGDITQIDLPNKKQSGLITVKRILQNVKGISFCIFDKKDVVRHPLVQRIIDAYENFKE